MKDPEIKTYGCRLNFYESEVIRKYAKDNNLQNHIFINSCAVTNKTIADLKNEIRKVKKENQQSQVVLTGCAAQIHKKDFEAMSEVEQDEQDQESLTDLELSDEQVNALTKSGIKNKDDLAELATDELMEIIDISEETASEMIMKAREHWFK